MFKKKSVYKGLDEKIARKLEKICPVFYRSSYVGTVWHSCLCKGRENKGERSYNRYLSCDCVWHRTATCPAGTWPQLSFIPPPPPPAIPPPLPTMEDAKKACRMSNEKAQKKVKV